MAFVTSREDKRVLTTTGHSFSIKAKQPHWVPDMVLKHMFEAGCMECDEHGKLILHEAAAEEAGDNVAPEAELLKLVPVLTAEERLNSDKRFEAAKGAVRYLQKVGNPTDFRTDNVPKAKSLARVLGFDIHVSELLKAFDAVQKE